MQLHNRIVFKIKYILSFFLVLGALFAAGHRATAFAEGDRVYYFNMDSNGLQGNMILVESDGHWGLLDAGHRYAKTIQDENGRTYSTTVNGLSSQINCRNGRDVANYMINYLGVTHLDFIVGTHAHSDHIGGIPELVATTFLDDQGNTRSLVDSTTTYYYKEYEHISNLEDDLEKYSSSSWHNQAFAYQAESAMQGAGATLVDLSKLDAFSDLPEGLTFVQRGELGDEYGDSVEFTVGGITFRLYNLYEHTDTGNENVNSIVAVMSNGEYTVVNLADINTNHGAIDKVSQAIAEAYGTVDIVVAGHHGNAGSNTKEMFDQLQPDYVIVSNGSSPTSWFYTTGDLAAAIPYANARYGTDFYSTQISYYATVTDLSGNAVHIYSVNNIGDLADAMDRVLKANGKKTGWVSWVNTDSTLWTYLEKGNSVKDAWRKVSNKWYHFDEYGIMQTGWITADGNEYFLNDSGAAVSGWKQRGDDWYYLNPNKNGFGKVLTGWQTIGGKKYFLADDGVMQKNMWKDGYYLQDNGAMAVGWQLVDGNWYYLNANSKAKTYGKYLTGWQTIGGKKYFFADDGVMQKNMWKDDFYLTDSGAVAAGWLQLDDGKYYLDPNTKNKTFGKKLLGWRTISKSRYYFDEDGRMVAGAWVDNSYLKDDGAMAVGWLEIDGNWFYLNTNTKAKTYGKYLTGWQTIGGKKYFFEDDGAMLHSIWKDDYYLTDSGAVATGWQTIDGKKYYFDPNTKNKTFGRKLYGWRNIGGKYYYLDGDDGHMISGTWVDGCYLKDDGVMATGWLEIAGNWYYLNPDSKAKGYGRMMTGWRTIGGKKYYFNDDGVMLHDVWQDDFYLTTSGAVATGWQTIDGKTYYFDPNTKNKTFGRKLYGWRNIGGKYYYLDGDDGHMISGTWMDGCYLKDDGVMATGWQELNGNYYYLNPDSKAKGYGRMMTGWRTIGGKKYYFNDDGVMLHDVWQDDFYLTTSGAIATGWQTIDGKTYYLDPNTKNKSFGRKLYGWKNIGGKYYYLDGDDGHMISGAWVDNCYLKDDGVMATGWLELNGNYYYLNPDSKARGYGRIMTGWQTINGKRYYFNDNGVMLHDDWQDGYYLGSDGARAVGLVETASGTYYLDPNTKNKTYGRVLTGWRSISNKWYYFGDDGRMVAGTWVDGCYLTADGTMATGLQVIDGYVYYLNANGKKQTGWQTVNGKKYFFDENGRAVTGTWTNDGVYLTADGTMATGIQTIEGVTYYLDASGHAQGGWHEGYYFGSDGILVTNDWTPDGCYVIGDGSVATGVQLIDGVTYYLDASGHAQGGWHEGYYFGSDGTLVTNDWTPDGYYVTDDGTMATGWKQIGDAWYYFNADGSMVTGWLDLDSGTYYLAPDGVMAVGEQEIDGVMYYFNPDGSLYIPPAEVVGYNEEGSDAGGNDGDGGEENGNDSITNGETDGEAA